MKSQEILLLEDNPETVAGTIAELESKGITVDQVKYLDAAVERLGEKQYDALLLDWRVPDRKDGFVNDDAGGDLLAQLSSGKLGRKNRDLPVVIVTAQARAVNYESARLHKQCVDIVPKMQFGRLMASVEKALARKMLKPTRLRAVLKGEAAQEHRTYMPVKIIAFHGDGALCKARFEGFWLKIKLDRASLEKVGLKEGDGFEWAVNEDGIIRIEDIRCHPHKADPGDYEKAQRVFSKLTKLTKQSGDDK